LAGACQADIWRGGRTAQGVKFCINILLNIFVMLQWPGVMKRGPQKWFSTACFALGML